MQGGHFVERAECDDQTVLDHEETITEESSRFLFSADVLLSGGYITTVSYI